MKVVKFFGLIVVTVLFMLLEILSASPAVAQVLFSTPQPFKVTAACNATRSIASGSDPVALIVGQSYTAFGTNREPGGTHANIEIDGERKWVALTCGELPPNLVRVPTVTSTEPTVLPFFDQTGDLVLDGGFDVTPPPPQLDEFDRAVVEVCGLPGKQVSREEFQALMQSFPGVLADIKQFSGGRVFGNRPVPASDEAYLADLTDAWFNIQGFDHIFCGEPRKGGAIGGLHFHGRYLDLQNRGLGGLFLQRGRSEIVPGAIYTIGAFMNVDGGVARSPIKGYGYTLSAADILKFATQAFADNPTASTTSVACLLPVSDDSQSFTAVFVRRASGIRTFFPDATPSGDPGCTILAAPIPALAPVVPAIAQPERPVVVPAVVVSQPAAPAVEPSPEPVAASNPSCAVDVEALSGLAPAQSVLSEELLSKLRQQLTRLESEFNETRTLVQQLAQ